MLLVQCVCRKGDGHRGTEVSTSQVSRISTSNGHQLKVSVSLLLCVHVVSRLFIPTTRAVDVLYLCCW